MKITICGAGAWGTALANLLIEGGNSVTMWGHDPAQLDTMRREGSNECFLPGIQLAPGLILESDFARAGRDADLLVMAVASRFFRSVAARLPDYRGLVVSVTKGVEDATGLTMSGILGETMPHAIAVALSGPSLAPEVARHIPTAVVAAHPDSAASRQVQQLFSRPSFRVYTSDDVIGVELGGALKNVVAIAAGVGDGLGFGDNAKAALITRAIVEIRRLGVACGAKADTFNGLSGLGDLTVTCFSKLSRNRTFGERLGRGEKAGEVLAASVSVVEGYPTALSAHHLAHKLGVQTPIQAEVHAMLYEGKDVRQAVQDLMNRDLKAE